MEFWRVGSEFLRRRATSLAADAAAVSASVMLPSLDVPVVHASAVIGAMAFEPTIVARGSRIRTRLK